MHKKFGQDLAKRVRRLVNRSSALYSLDSFLGGSNSSKRRNDCIRAFEAAEEASGTRKLRLALWFETYTRAVVFEPQRRRESFV